MIAYKVIYTPKRKESGSFEGRARHVPLIAQKNRERDSFEHALERLLCFSGVRGMMQWL